MFKFDFNLQEAGTNFATSEEQLPDIPQSQNAQKNALPPFVASTVDELIKGLPPRISYSPLRIPIPGGLIMVLLRRDLFDARFQLISEDKASKDLDFIDDPSDLVPGIYEGGLKTWECSADLAGHLRSEDPIEGPRSYKMIEIGCGTAIPSMGLLQKIFDDPRSDGNLKDKGITLHLQDYNLTVLQLMTLPNIMLTWYASRASSSYRASQSLPAVDNAVPGELSITPELISSFLDSLRQLRIRLEFFGGAWSDLETRIRDASGRYDMVVTSETIYQSTSLPDLVSLLKVVCTSREGEETDIPPANEFSQLSLRQIAPTRCLIAAKVIYFGVGGSIDEFEKVVHENGGRLDMVFEKKAGVGRRIMSLIWN